MNEQIVSFICFDDSFLNVSKSNDVHAVLRYHNVVFGFIQKDPKYLPLPQMLALMRKNAIINAAFTNIKDFQIICININLPIP